MSEDSAKPPPKPAPSPAEEREARLAAALRSNLRRRKTVKDGKD